MKKNRIRLWQLAGLGAVLLAAKVYSNKKPKAIPGAVIDARDDADQEKVIQHGREDTAC